MDRPRRYAGHRWLGDKRSQVAHDVDACTAPELVQALLRAEAGMCFAPDTLAEVRNRDYHRCRSCSGSRAAAAAEQDARPSWR